MQLQLVPPHDPATAAAQVVELLRDDRRRVDLGARGKAFVARYDYRLMAQAELARLQAICDRAEVSR